MRLNRYTANLCVCARTTDLAGARAQLLAEAGAHNPTAGSLAAKAVSVSQTNATLQRTTGGKDEESRDHLMARLCEMPWQAMRATAGHARVSLQRAQRLFNAAASRGCVPLLAGMHLTPAHVCMGQRKCRREGSPTQCYGHYGMHRWPSSASELA